MNTYQASVREQQIRALKRHATKKLWIFNGFWKQEHEVISDLSQSVVDNIIYLENNVSDLESLDDLFVQLFIECKKRGDNRFKGFYDVKLVSNIEELFAIHCI